MTLLSHSDITGQTTKFMRPIPITSPSGGAFHLLEVFGEVMRNPKTVAAVEHSGPESYYIPKSTGGQESD